MNFDRETFSWHTLVHWLFHWNYNVRDDCFECAWERLFWKKRE